MTKLLEATPVQVCQYGELVELTVGTEKWSMPFDVALSLSHALLTEGRVARKLAGHKGAALRAAGSFTEPTTFKQNRWQRMATRLSKSKIHVRANGPNVNLDIGNSGFGIPFEAALTISQWLRLHGKAARNAAGEKASWADIATGA